MAFFAQRPPNHPQNTRVLGQIMLLEPDTYSLFTLHLLAHHIKSGPTLHAEVKVGFLRLHHIVSRNHHA